MALLNRHVLVGLDSPLRARTYLLQPAYTCALGVAEQAAAGPDAEAVIVPGAGHGMHGHERECVDAVLALLDKLPHAAEAAS